MISRHTFTTTSGQGLARSRSRKRNRSALALVIAVGLSLALLPPRAALACGGCFSPPGPNLVVQDAERILFYRDPVTKKTVVHVEVRYSGPAKDFGWVLPLPKKPKVGVGSSYVFDRLDQATAPRFYTKFASTQENCHFSDANSSGFGCAAADMAVNESTRGASGSLNAPTSGGQDGKSSVTIVEQAQAGPYDYKILSSTDSKALLAWLNDNGYDTPKKALPVIESHLAKGDLFVAFKLVNGAGVDEIRPVTLEMDDSDACVPLRLTAIAASDNMAVVVYLLGAGRGVPKNHMHVRVNETKLRWAGGVNNYPQVLAAAIDEAAGRAFVTEFSGPSQDLTVSLPDFGFRVDSTALFSKAIPNPQGGSFGRAEPITPIADSVWKAGDLFDKRYLNIDKLEKATSAEDVVLAVQQSKFLIIAETAAILEKATGLAAANGSGKTLDFWTRVRAGSIKPSYTNALKPVDALALTKELKEGIIEPIYIINDALQAKNMVLTRLQMRISPDEMDRDPIFAFNPKLPSVTMNHTAELRQVCTKGDFNTDAMRLTLKSGSWIFPKTTIDFQANQQARVSTSVTTSLTEDPRFKEAPFASRVEVLEESGQPVPVPKAQIDLVDTAIAGAVVGKPSLPTSLALKGALATWQPPKSDPDAGLKTAAEEAHATAGGCSQQLGLRGPFAGMLLLLVAMTSLLLLRRRRDS